MERSASLVSGLWFAGTKAIVRVRAADSAGRLGVWESEEPRGTALPLHVHTREDEQVLLLDGTIAVMVGDRVHHLGAGATLALPRDVPHAHVVTSEQARILTVAAPGGFEQLFLDLGVPAVPGTAAPAPDIRAMAEAVARLGVRIVGPPPAIDVAGDVVRRPPEI
jgi:quercetin dioxygenase-like cupin family protein